MGRRGPLPGQGGRPTDRERAEKQRKPPNTADKADFASDLSDLTFDDLVELCGKWQPLTAPDCVTVAALWECVQRYRQLVEVVEAKPVSEWTYTQASGSQQPIPELRLLSSTRNDLLALASQFGLSPAARARQHAAPVEITDGGSPFAEHMAGVRALDGKKPRKSKTR